MPLMTLQGHNALNFMLLKSPFCVGHIALFSLNILALRKWPLSLDQGRGHACRRPTEGFEVGSVGQPIFADCNC